MFCGDINTVPCTVTSAVQLELRLYTPGRIWAFLISAQDEGELSASRPAALFARKEFQLPIE